MENIRRHIVVAKTLPDTDSVVTMVAHLFSGGAPEGAWTASPFRARGSQAGAPPAWFGLCRSLGQGGDGEF